MSNIRKLKKLVVTKFQKEAPKDLYYHGIHHTLYVLQVCNDYIRRLKIKHEDAFLLRTAALLHDIAIFSSHKDHEENSVAFARNLLQEWGYDKAQIKKIEGMIMSTKLPQNPKTLLEEIICDADVDYLGTDLFYSVGHTLYKEFLAYGIVSNSKEWDQLQIKFLQNHSYHTAFAKKYRRPQKLKYLNELKSV